MGDRTANYRADGKDRVELLPCGILVAVAMIALVVIVALAFVVGMSGVQFGG